MDRKMSKSEKNFITIKEILEKFTGRQMRMLFLLHNWETKMNYNYEETFIEPKVKERQFFEFF